jgi:hypothetical protein
MYLQSTVDHAHVDRFSGWQWFRTTSHQREARVFTRRQIRRKPQVQARDSSVGPASNVVCLHGNGFSRGPANQLKFVNIAAFANGEKHGDANRSLSSRHIHTLLHPDPPHDARRIVMSVVGGCDGGNVFIFGCWPRKNVPRAIAVVVCSQDHAKHQPADNTSQLSGCDHFVAPIKTKWNSAMMDWPTNPGYLQERPLGFNYPAFSVETERDRGLNKVVIEAAGANFREEGATSTAGCTNGGWLSTDSGTAPASVRTTWGLWSTQRTQN